MIDENAPWWRRPIRALALGFAAGLALTWLIAELPDRAQSPAMLLLLAVAFGYCLWMLYDLKRMQRRFAAQLEVWRQEAGP